MVNFRRTTGRDNKGRVKFHPPRPSLRGNCEFPKNNKNNHKPHKKNKEVRFDNCHYCKHKIVFTVGTAWSIKGLNVLHLNQNGRRSKKCHESGCECDKPSIYSA